MTRRDESDEYVETRLREWADWYKTGGQDFGLGFPKETIEWRLYTQGCIVKQTSGAIRVLPTNIRAEEIEKCVMDLQKLKSLHAKLLREWYFADKRTPKEAIATSLNISKRTAEDKLRECRFFVLRFLSERWCHNHEKI